MGLSALVGVFANVLAQGIAFVLTAGIMIFTLKLLRGEAARFEDLFLGFKNFGTYFVAGIIIGVASFLGVFACIIGTVFVQGLLMFVAPLIYDRNLSAMDAAKQSVEMLKSQWAMAGAYYFITALFAFVGVFACCIGIIVTAPILYIAQALAYHKFAGSPTGEAFLSPSGYPRDPSTMGNMPEAPTSWTVGETPAPASEPAPSIDPEPPSSPEQPSNVDSDATTFENPAVDGGDSSEDPKGPG
jgi:hypothetical protein